jgi:hypothetical protein
MSTSFPLPEAQNAGKFPFGFPEGLRRDALAEILCAYCTFPSYSMKQQLFPQEVDDRPPFAEQQEEEHRHSKVVLTLEEMRQKLEELGLPPTMENLVILRDFGDGSLLRSRDY